MKLVCTECGHRQDAPDRCARCGDDAILELAKPDTRELLADIDDRRRHQRDTHVHFAAVALAIGVVVTLWCVPGYWAARHKYFALPVVIDQILLFVAVGIAASKLLAVMWKVRPRFPFILDE